MSPRQRFRAEYSEARAAGGAVLEQFCARYRVSVSKARPQYHWENPEAFVRWSGIMFRIRLRCLFCSRVATGTWRPYCSREHTELAEGLKRGDPS